MPGLYVYHCATPMVAHHIANGMYGLILVEPEGGLPPVDHEFYVMQGEIYTEAPFGQRGSQEFSVEKLLNERPEYFVFNGSVGALSKLHPMKAKVGETVRIFFGVGGPNYTSSFHVIGEIFDRVYNMGDLISPPMRGVQTITVPAGGAAIVEFKLDVPGNYILVDHALSRAERGLVGILQVEGPPNPEIFEGKIEAGGAPLKVIAIRMNRDPAPQSLMPAQRFSRTAFAPSSFSGHAMRRSRSRCGCRCSRARSRLRLCSRRAIGTRMKCCSAMSPAVLTGFLLTAIPNWTGRLPLQGTPLLALVVVWLAGRFAVAWSTHLGWACPLHVDCAFLVLVVAAAAREIIAGHNWRNLKVLIPVCGSCARQYRLSCRGVCFPAVADFRIRAAIAAIVILIILIGGRIVPSFTRNWLVRENPGRLPPPFGRFDAASIAVSAAASACGSSCRRAVWTGAALLVAGALQCVRLARWAGDRTARERLVLILHIAYAFVPLGFALAGSGIVRLGSSQRRLACLDGWSGRNDDACGHDPREPRPYGAGACRRCGHASDLCRRRDRGLCARGGALFRIWTFALLHVAALAWIAAFGGFAVLYGPILFRHKQELNEWIGTACGSLQAATASAMIEMRRPRRRRYWR